MRISNGCLGAVISWNLELLTWNFELCSAKSAHDDASGSRRAAAGNPDDDGTRDDFPRAVRGGGITGWRDVLGSRLVFGAEERLGLGQRVARGFGRGDAFRGVAASPAFESP